MVQPVGAVKLAGKVSGTNVAFLSAVDDVAGSASRARPSGVQHPARAARHRHLVEGRGHLHRPRRGQRYNRVADVDGGYLFGGIYSLPGTARGERHAAAGRQRAAPRRSGTRGSTATAGTSRSATRSTACTRTSAQAPATSTAAGVVNADARPALHLVRRAGRAGGGADLQSRLLQHVALPELRARGRRDREEAALHPQRHAARRVEHGHRLLRRDLRLRSRALRQLPPARCRRTTRCRSPAVPRIPNSEAFLSFGTPSGRRVSASAFYLWGRDENFFEWAIVEHRHRARTGSPSGPRTGCARRRPTTSRASTVAPTAASSATTASRGSRWSTRSRARCSCGWWASTDSSIATPCATTPRTGLPIITYDRCGGFQYQRTVACQRSAFRGDFLFSYQPNPGHGALPRLRGRIRRHAASRRSRSSFRAASASAATTARTTRSS